MKYIIQKILFNGEWHQCTYYESLSKARWLQEIALTGLGQANGRRGDPPGGKKRARSSSDINSDRECPSSLRTPVIVKVSSPNAASTFKGAACILPWLSIQQHFEERLITARRHYLCVACIKYMHVAGILLICNRSNVIAASDHKMAKLIQEGLVRIEDSPDVGLGRRCASFSIDATTFMKVIMYVCHN